MMKCLGLDRLASEPLFEIYISELLVIDDWLHPGGLTSDVYEPRNFYPTLKRDWR